ncbi:MAG: Rne/Rng family ribonuclease [Salinivirgaceae bacterium]|nr:Rne/Rng family ribonuclease [Salinivirgaceae bacterium]
MNKELVINSTPSEVVIALMEDKRLVELNREKTNFNYAVGDIYLAKVKKVMPGLNAAFVNVGYEKDAFLHYLDLGPQFKSLNDHLQNVISRKNWPVSINNLELAPDIDKHGKINQVLKEGQLILVQIAKEPISTKGPRLTSEISIAGRNLVLIPFSNRVSISQKIKSDEVKKHLHQMIESVKPKNYGVIVRTVAENCRISDLDAELRELVEKWENAFNIIRKSTPPKLVIGELDRTTSMLRDSFSPDFNSIYTNDKKIFEEAYNYIHAIAPEQEKIVKFYDKGQPIFDHFGLEKQIKTLFGKVVVMQKGAYLVIEHTEALHVIDVNSGNRTQNNINQEDNAIDVNMIAAAEIARQLRLRDMGGIIVIDFIDMHTAENKQKLYEYMKECMAGDRARHHVLPLSKFGLIQITRQRVRPETKVHTTEKCPSCNGTGEVTPPFLIVDELENIIRWGLTNYKNKRVNLVVHPFIAAYLNKGLFSIKMRWKMRYLHRLRVIPSIANTFLEFNFLDKKNEKIYL